MTGSKQKPIEFDMKEYDETKQLKVLFPNEKLDQLPDLISYIEESKLYFVVKANTLEDAYINLDRKLQKANKKSDQAFDTILEEIMKTPYQGTFIAKSCSMFIRKIYHYFSSALMIMVNLFYGLLPGLISTFTIYSSVGSLGSFTGIGFSSLYFVMLCGLFNTSYIQTLVRERETKMRFVLNMSGVNAVSYYVGTFIAD